VTAIPLLAREAGREYEASVQIRRKNTLEIALGSHSSGRFIPGKIWVSGDTPLPPPFECLDWRGFCKKCLQNLDANNLEVKILTTQELGPLSRYLSIPPQP
jgi:hypothetical protein